MKLVNDIDLVATVHRCQLDTVPDLPYIIYAIITGGIYLDNINAVVIQVVAVVQPID